MDARFDFSPIAFGQAGLPPDEPKWGSAYKKALAKYFTRSMFILTHGTSMPLETNNITLDPKLKDDHGLPALRTTYKDHPDDLKLQQFLNARALEILDAAGAQKKWTYPISEQNFAVHLLGTCRMGNDPKTSVINADHRAHDVPNLFLCDGSSFVTSGRGQPTMTIMALAFRAADRMTAMAKRGEI
jgi:choline dehydrogenase-like flavoprotein